MKATIDRRTLTDALTLAAKALPRRTQYPVLHSVRLAVTPDNCLSIAATDLDIFSVQTIPLNGHAREDGVAVLPGRDLLKLSKEIPGDEVTIETADKGPVKVGYAVLSPLDPDEYPEPPAHGEVKAALDIPGDVLAGLLDKVDGLQLRDASRPAMMGIRLEHTKATLRLVATDGYRLGVAEADGGYGPALSLILPPSLLAYIPRKVKRGQPWPIVRLTVEERPKPNEPKDTERLFWLTVGNLSVKFPPIDGPYPDWQRVISPRDKYPLTVTTKRAELARILRAVLPFSHPTGRLTALTITADSLTAKSETPELGTAEQSIPVKAEWSGPMPDSPQFRIGLNCAYLIHLLGLSDRDTVTLRFKNPTSATTIREPRAKWLIMPIPLD